VAGEPHRITIAEKPLRNCPGLFLDRDGTLMEDPGYVSRPDQVRLIPGITGALKRFRDAGYALVVVTNQSGIGRGLYTWDDYDAVAARLEKLLAAEGISFDAVLACSHAPDEGCDWRKPAPGMIREAATLLSLDLGRSLLAGDKLSDLEAAAAVGLPRAVHVASGQGARERTKVCAGKPAIAIDLVDSLATLAS
jgi:D-glycero-D-manno-heptose 1,7-bisphosphate phosphatase